MMRHRYHGLMDHWMVDLCEDVIGESLLKMGYLSLVLPSFSYFMTIASYAFVSNSLRLRTLANITSLFSGNCRTFP